MIVGLTGGIASGKSTVSNFFRELGVEIVDADLVAREISEKKESIEKIKNIFGEDVIDNEGKVIRERLREKVFKDRGLLEKLNGIIHPQVIEYFQKIRDNNREELIIFDIPLLYETKMEYLCDRIVVVGVEKSEQIARVISRDGSSEELAKKIIESQMSLEDKIKRADIVIINDGSLEELKGKVIEVYNLLKREVNR